MLAKAFRIRTGNDYRMICRRGKRRTGRFMTAHTLQSEGDSSASFGFIISKAVGNSPFRNLQRRRMKHICSELVRSEAFSGQIVFRLNPRSAQASYLDLKADVVKTLKIMNIQNSTASHD